MGAPARPASNWPAVGAVFAAGIVAATYLTKVPPAIPALRGELGLTLVQSGLVATMFNVIGMASGMLAGVLGDRFGYKRLALAGLVILAVGGGLGAAAGGFTLLLVSRFLEGAGFILCVVSSPTLITAVTANARDRIKALGMWSAYMPTGGSIALLVAPLVLAAWGWRGLWAVLALATAACAVVFARVVPETPPGKTRSLRLVIESLKQKGYVAMALLFLFYVAQWTSILIWLPTFLVEQGLSAGAAAGAAAAMVVANIPGNLAAGVLLARGVPRGTIVVVSAVLAALCEVGMFSDGLPGALRMALVLAFSTVAGAMPGTIFSGLPVHAPSPRHIATGNGMALQASNLGQFLGPLAIAWMASHLGGWDAALWALLAFAAGAAACGVAIGRIEKRLCARG